MKLLSQMTTDEVCDALCVAAPAVQAMADDEQLVAEIQRVLPQGEHSKMDIYRFGVSRLAVLVPIILKAHRNDLYTALSPFNGVPVEDFGKQRFLVTLGQVRELVKDKDLIDFFSSSFDMGQKA